MANSEEPRMRRVVLLSVITAAVVLASTAGAAGPLVITNVGDVNRHLVVSWQGPALEFGVVQTAARPETGTDGNFFTENRVSYDVFEQRGVTTWTSTDQFGPGTYFVRVDGWDPTFEYDAVFGDWSGGDAFSNIVSYTIQPVCRLVLVRAAQWKMAHGKRVRVKAVYRQVCS